MLTWMPSHVLAGATQTVAMAFPKSSFHLLSALHVLDYINSDSFFWRYALHLALQSGIAFKMFSFFGLLFDSTGSWDFQNSP